MWLIQLKRQLDFGSVMVSGSWDRAPRWAQCSVANLLEVSLPSAPPPGHRHGVGAGGVVQAHSKINKLINF